jgi:hypothetical protein
MKDHEQTAYNRWKLYFQNDQIPTCRMTWGDCSASGGTFESKATPENKGMQHAPIGSQRGTYFKTSKYVLMPEICPEPMQVWRWGGRDWDDIRSGAWNGCM